MNQYGEVFVLDVVSRDLIKLCTWLGFISLTWTKDGENTKCNYILLIILWLITTKQQWLKCNARPFPQICFTVGFMRWCPPQQNIWQSLLIEIFLSGRVPRSPASRTLGWPSSPPSWGPPPSSTPGGSGWTRPATRWRSPGWRPETRGPGTAGWTAGRTRSLHTMSGSQVNYNSLLLAFKSKI